MKKIFLFTAFLLSINLTCAQWTQTGGPQGGQTNCVTRVGNQIWTGTNNGVYISNDDGQTWQRSPIAGYDECYFIVAKGDTIIVGYGNGAANDSSITSFDGAATWHSPVDIGIAARCVASVVKSAIVLFDIRYISHDNGLSWAGYTPPFENGQTEVFYYNDSATVIAFSFNYDSYYSSLYISTDAVQSWHLLDSAYYDDNATLVDGPIILTGLITTDSLTPYTLLRSANSGISWDTVLTLPHNYVPNSIYNISGLYYFWIENGPTLAYYRSSDDGLTWQGPIYSNNVGYVDGRFGVKLNNGSYLQMRTAKGMYTALVNYIPLQDTFFTVNTGINAQLIYSLFSNRNVLFAGAFDDLYRSTDGGQTWAPSGLGASPVWDMAFIGDTVFGAGIGYLIRSFNNGISWDTIKIQNQGLPQDFSSVTYSNGHLVYSATSFCYSDDLGATWDSMPGTDWSASRGDIIGAVRTISGNFIAVGNGGEISQFNWATHVWDSVTIFYSPGAHNWNQLYVVDSALVMSGRAALMTSVDNGHTWINSPLIGIPVYQFAPVVPRNIISYHGLWLGTVITGDLSQTQLYFSADKGSSWQQLPGAGQAFIPSLYSVQNLTMMNNVLYSGSEGNSVWRFANSFNSISGNVYRDLNNNGVKDVGEPGLNQQLISTLPSNIYTTTDTAGNYTLVTYAVGDTLKPCTPVFFGTISPAFRITPNVDTVGQNFGIYVPGNVADLSVDITNLFPFSWTSPENNVAVTATNKGSLPQIATIQLVLDSGLSYSGANPIPDYISLTGDTLRWITDTLQFLQSKVITLSVNVVGQIGDPVVCHAIITPLANDTMQADNYTTLRDSITGPFDPNSKQCLQGGSITPQQAAQHAELDYVIRFQNDGNAPAVNIMIADTLSPYLDASTFHVVSSSSPVTYYLYGNGIVDFYFNNINLPPSSSGADSSSGFVKYAVNCKSSLDPGNAISNTASIYFDNNLPVVTNTTVTSVDFTTTGVFPDTVMAITFTPSMLTDIKVYPNPTNNLVHIDLGALTGPNTTIEIYDETGRIIKAIVATHQLQTIYMSEVAEGIYFGRVVNNGQLKASFKIAVVK